MPISPDNPFVSRFLPLTESEHGSRANAGPAGRCDSHAGHRPHRAQRRQIELHRSMPFVPSDAQSFEPPHQAPDDHQQHTQQDDDDVNGEPFLPDVTEEQEQRTNAQYVFSRSSLSCFNGMARMKKNTKRFLTPLFFCSLGVAMDLVTD